MHLPPFRHGLLEHMFVSEKRVSHNWTFLFIRGIIHSQFIARIKCCLLTSFTMYSTVPCYAPASVLSLPLIVTGPSVLTWVACALYNDFEESTNILKLLSNPCSNHRLIKYSEAFKHGKFSLHLFLYTFFNDFNLMKYTHRSVCIISYLLPCL